VLSRLLAVDLRCEFADILAGHIGRDCLPVVERKPELVKPPPGCLGATSNCDQERSSKGFVLGGVGCKPCLGQGFLCFFDQF